MRKSLKKAIWFKRWSKKKSPMMMPTILSFHKTSAL